MDEALAFTGETGPYIQNGVVRARNIFAKLEAEGHRVAGSAGRAGALDLAPSGRRGGRRGLVAADADGAHATKWRSRRCAPRRWRSWPNTPSPWPRPSTPTTRSRAYSVLHAESDDLRAFRMLVVDAFVRQMEALTACSGIPVPERM